MKIQLNSISKTRTVIFLHFFLSLHLNASPLIPVSELLDGDGKIKNKHHLSGSVDFSGFYPIFDHCNGLMFLPMPIVPGWNALGNGLNNIVECVVLSGSDVYVGGSFTDAGGNIDADNIALWDGTNWNALGTGLNNTVNAISLSGSNVYVGGSFTNGGGNASADRIARWDGSTWNPLGTGLTSIVEDISILGGDVYVGGSFTNAGGNSNANRIARWDGSIWNPLGTGVNGTVNVISLSGSNVYVGGSFTSAGGNASAGRIARWDGSTWNPLGSGLNNIVNAIAISGTEVYVGGNFTNAGGTINADKIARWDGSTWNALGSGLNNAVNIIKISGSNVYVGGGFTDAGGNNNANFIARWDGSTWNALDNGLNGQVNVIALSGTDVYVGGSFIDAGGNSDADNISRWEFGALPVELISFDANLIEKSARLDWLVANQIKNDGWKVEHSTDIIIWEQIGWVKGDGNESTLKRFYFHHLNPKSGQNYYRLGQTDFDGSTEYSKVVTVKLEIQEDIYLYPTLTTGIVYIEGNAEKIEEINVYDALGNLRLKVSQTNKIDLSAEIPGIYFLQVLYKGKLTTRRVIRQ